MIGPFASTGLNFRPRVEQESGSASTMKALNREQLKRLHFDLCEIYAPDQVSFLIESINQLLSRYENHREGSSSFQPIDGQDALLIVYADSINQGEEHPLRTLSRFLSTHLDSMFSIVHLLAAFPYSSDRGFSITDYYQINPAAGDQADLLALSCHTDMMLDVVLNHCSRQHAWFQNFLAGQSGFRNWFIQQNPKEPLLDRVARPRSSPLLTPITDQKGQTHWLWTTFGKDQIDLNFKNPEVFLEMINIILTYLAWGARILRLDAIAYVWKILGTACINLPQVHALVRVFRLLIEQAQPGSLLLTETNIPTSDNLSYFGKGDEAHLVYQFPLPPLLLHALWKENVNLLRNWLETLPSPPAGCAYLNFTASHDGIGLRPIEGLIDEEEKTDWLAAMTAQGARVSLRQSAEGPDTPYELNITWFSAMKTRDDGQEHQFSRFLLTQTLMMALQGIPAFYIHALLAATNDWDAVEKSGHFRDINRGRFDYPELERILANPDSIPARSIRDLRYRLALRSQLPQLSPATDQQVLNLDPSVLGLIRDSRSQRPLLILVNFSATTQEIPSTLLPFTPTPRGTVLGMETCHFDEVTCQLKPWSTLWVLPDPPANQGS